MLDAVLIDENISQEVIVNPVFIKKDGRVYDLSMIEKIIASNGKNPFNQEMVFKKEDIIPCNTLIKAIQLLLLIIDQHEICSQPVEKNKFDPSQEILSEAFYQKLPPKHQRLFDIICRDPMTNMIMKDPVFLPDGYAYDRSTAEILLESAKTAECPLDKNILFTKEDITKCYLIDSVYEYLKKMAAHQTEILIEEVKKIKIL